MWRHPNTLVSIPIWDFYFDISECHIQSARAWTPALMLHLTNPCAKRKVLSLTKLKGKIFKTESISNYITHKRLRFSGTNCLLSSEFGSSTRGERQFLKVFRNHTMLTTPKRSAHLVVQSQFLKIIVGPQLLTIIVGPQLQLCAIEADNPTVCLPGPKSTPNWLFFKIFKFSWPLFPSMTSFTLQPHFLSGVYYDNCEYQILCARA